MGVLRDDKGEIGSQGSDLAAIQIVDFHNLLLEKDEIDKIGLQYTVVGVI